VPLDMAEDTDTQEHRQADHEPIIATCPHCGDARELSREHLARYWDPNETVWLYFLCDNEDCPEGDFDWLLDLGDAREREAAKP
jgi:hypothetical protein